MIFLINEGKGAVKLEEKDLNQKAKNEGKNEFKIGLVFKDLPKDIIIDATNPTSLKDEFLLNRDGDLEIWKIFKNGKLQNTFIKCYHPANDEFIKDLMKKKIKDLQDFVDNKKIDFSSSIDKRKSADLRKVIREYYKQNHSDLKLEDVEIKIDEEGLKEIWSKLKNYMPVYAIFHADRENVEQDEEIQDPLKVKIEEIFKRSDIQNKLKEVADEIDKEIRVIAENTIGKFNQISKGKFSINLKPNIPDVESLKWKDVYKNIGFFTDDDIPLNKRGSGIRRLVLISSFLAEAERKITDESDSSNIIYAIEEPETSLHPDLQKILVDSLKELSEDGKHQILFSTHSPALIRLVETSSIRYVEQENGVVKVESFNDKVADKIVKNLGLLPSIGKIVICVEGLNDEKFLSNINQNIPELKAIIDLQEKIKSGSIVILPMGGNNLSSWIDRHVLENTNAMEFHLYDRDSDEKYKKYVESVNKRKDGSFGTLTKKREIENYIPKEIIEEEFNIELDNIDDKNWDNEDIPKKIEVKCSKKEKAIKEELCGHCSKKLTKEHLEKLNAWEEVKGWFEKIKEMCDKVV